MLAHLLAAPITCATYHKMSHLCCAVFVSIVSSLLLSIRHCDMDAAAEFCHYLVCVLFVRVHHDVTVV